MQVLAARTTSLPVWSLTSHSTYPRVLPAFTILASAVRVAFRTARRKVIFSSMVVNVSPSPAWRRRRTPSQHRPGRSRRRRAACPSGVVPLVGLHLKDRVAWFNGLQYEPKQAGNRRRVRSPGLFSVLVRAWCHVSYLAWTLPAASPAGVPRQFPPPGLDLVGQPPPKL